MSRRSSARRSWLQRSVLALNVGLIAVCLTTAWVLELSWRKASSVTRVQLAASLAPAEPDGAGKRVVNLLLVGSDSSDTLDPDDPINDGRQGERNGDVIIVARLDERDGSAALLSFPRDLWVTLAGSERQAKINAAFAVGGPAGLIDTIDQNFGIPINYYVNVDFAGFEGLVEAVGSVEVFFPEPARDWNPATQATQTGFEMLNPGCHALDPPLALAYVRSRYYQRMIDGRWVTDPTSDLGRIRRQQDFLERLAERAIDLGARNPFVLSELIDTALEHVSIDQELTPQRLLDLGRSLGSFEPGELQSYTFPSRSGMVGAASAELPQEDLADPLVNLFRGAASNDPSTVGLEVYHERQREASAEELLQWLEREGFELEDRVRAGLEPGIVVWHGPDGVGAAAVVAASLTESGSQVEVRPLPAGEGTPLVARNVRVTIGPVPEPSEEPGLPPTTDDPAEPDRATPEAPASDPCS